MDDNVAYADDPKRLFEEDTLEKKIIARSARNKKSHSGCNLPSDYMSRKEVEQMNGEVQIINTDLHRPLTWKYFRMLPKEEQTNYIQYLLDTFYCTGKQIADKFKLNSTYLCKYIRQQLPDVKLPHGGGYYSDRLMAGAWEKFWSGEEETKPENTSESLQNAPETTNTASEGEDATEESVGKTSDCDLWKERSDMICAEKLESSQRQLKELEARAACTKVRTDLPMGQWPTAENCCDMARDEIITESADIVTFAFELRDAHDLKEILKYLKIVKWPEKNTVYMRISERG